MLEIDPNKRYKLHKHSTKDLDKHRNLPEKGTFLDECTAKYDEETGTIYCFSTRGFRWIRTSPVKDISAASDFTGLVVETENSFYHLIETE